LFYLYFSALLVKSADWNFNFFSLIYIIFIIIAMIFNIIYYYNFARTLCKNFIITTKIIFIPFLELSLSFLLLKFLEFFNPNYSINSYNFFNQNYFFFNTLANMPFHWENNSFLLFIYSLIVIGSIRFWIIKYNF